jgi:uncharacterized protein
MVWNFLVRYVQAFATLFVEMAPYLLLGFLFAGILHAFVRAGSLSKHLGKPGLWSAAKAAMLGVPLPLCSCGVIPTGLSLHKHGASKGATVSFLISTPQTGVDSFLATSALMGWPMALVRPVAAFVTGVVGGFITDKLQPVQKPVFTATVVPKGSALRLQPIAAPKVAVVASTCAGASCGCSAGAEIVALESGVTTMPLSWSKRVHSALHYGFVEMLDSIAKWLLIGLAAAALISLVVPDDFFTRYLSNYWLSVGVVLLVAVPLYVCATGSIPVALALMLKGMSPGVAFVFLMAGPATMASTIAVVGKALGRKTLYAYLGSIIVGAVLFGYVIDSVLPTAWFIPPMAHAHHQHRELLPMWLQYGSALLFAVLLLYSMLSRLPLRSRQAVFASEVPMMTATYAIETITCNNCKRHLEKDVGALPGVVRVTADVANSTLTVQGDVSRAAVQHAVENAGYKIVG